LNKYHAGYHISRYPADSDFNDAVEIVSGSIDTTDIKRGKHLVFVRGQDVQGNGGGLFSAVFFYLLF
jgi:hypothetical protein